MCVCCVCVKRETESDTEKSKVNLFIRYQELFTPGPKSMRGRRKGTEPERWGQSLYNLEERGLVRKIASC